MSGELGSLEELLSLMERYHERGVTDGLPVVPPARTLVEAMVAASGRDGEEVLGALAPSYRPLRVWDVAVNATMAGCRPEYLPVVLAALEAMMEPGFGLHHAATSTYGNGPLVLVNGPARRAIGVNCSGNVLGPGARANATIGRAVRLVMINVGGTIPGLTDFASFGHPGKYSLVVGEDEEHSPWAPYHVEAGCDPSDSAVTVLSATSPQRVGASVTARDVELLLLRVAAAISTLGGFGSTGWSEEFVFVGPEHRDALSAAGWTKADVRSFLFEHSGRPAEGVSLRSPGENRGDRSLFSPEDPRSRLPALGGGDGAGVGRDGWVPAFEEASDIHIVAAGGEGGHATMICSGQPGLDWGRHQTRRVAPGHAGDLDEAEPLVEAKRRSRRRPA